MASAIASRHDEPSTRQRLAWIALAAGLHGLLLWGHGATASKASFTEPARISPFPEAVRYDEVVFSALTSGSSRADVGAAADREPTTQHVRVARRTLPSPTRDVRVEAPAPNALATDLASIAEIAASATAVAATPLANGEEASDVSGGAGAGSGTGTGGSGEGAGRGGSLARAFPEPPTTSVRCAWPADGEDLDQDFERVTMRVRVSSSGRVIGADVSRSPSTMFSDAAIECARQVVFEPARDQQGRAITALSEPITVRFERYRPGTTWR